MENMCMMIIACMWHTLSFAVVISIHAIDTIPHEPTANFMLTPDTRHVDMRMSNAPQQRMSIADILVSAVGETPALRSTTCG